MKFSLQPSRRNDTYEVIERRITNREYNGDSDTEKNEQTYRAYILLEESTQEAKYNEEIADSSQ